MLDREKTLSTIVRNRFGKLASAQRDIFDDVEIYHQMWRAYMAEDETYPWDFQLVDPVVFSLLRNMMSRLNPDNSKVILEPTNEKITQSMVSTNQSVVNWELGEMNKTLTFYRFIFRGLLAGRAYLSTGWKFNKALEIQIDDYKRKVMRDVVNRAEAKNVRFQDIYIPNQNIPELEEQPYIIEDTMLNFGDMLDDNEATGNKMWKPEYLERIREKKMFETKMDFGIDLPIEDQDGLTKEDIVVRSQYVSALRMQTKAGDVIYVPKQQEDMILNVDETSEFWHGHYPYVTWTPFPEDDDFFSMGIVQPVADLQIAISSALNQFLTNARKQSNPMWIAGSKAKQTPDWQFVNRPDGVIRVAGDADQVKQVTVQDTTKSMVSVRQDLVATFEKATSMSSLYTSGVSGQTSPAINKTATGARVIDANIDLNMQMLVALFGSQALNKVGEHFVELNAQFITEEQTVKITGSNGYEFIKVSPEETTANFDVKSKPDTLMKMSPVAKQATLMNMKSMADQDKKVDIDTVPIWKAIIENTPEMEGVDTVIRDANLQAEEAIQEIMNGVLPETTADQDHKKIMMIVQKHLLDMQHDPATEELFIEYLKDLNKWVMASNANMLMPQAPTPPVQQPIDEQAIVDSLNQQLPANPTEDLPQTIPMEDMGMM